MRATPTTSSRDLRAEARLERFGVEPGQCGSTVQHRRAHRNGVELQPGDNSRGAERTIEPGLAVAGAKISVVSCARRRPRRQSQSRSSGA